jgi:hypothetical protein
VHLTWVDAVEGGHELRYAVRAASGGPWGEPTTIASGSDWFVNWADTPSLAVGRDGQLLAHWLQKAGETPYAYHVMVSGSSDGGATWSAPRRLHEDDSGTEHGFATLLPQPDGGTLALWLDGRAMLEEGPMALRSRTVAADGTFGTETEVDDRTCDCCPTTAAVLPDGGVIAAWRDRSGEEVRDISIARLRGGAWEAPRTVAADQWTLAGCPVNGPAIDVAGTTVALAWFTLEGDRPRIQVTLSHDSGETFPVRTVLSENALGRVDAIALPDGGALVTWVEERGDKQAELVVVRVDRAGGTAGPPTDLVEISPARSSGLPRAVLGGDGRLVLAWTEITGSDKPITQVRTGVYGPL